MPIWRVVSPKPNFWRRATPSSLLRRDEGTLVRVGGPRVTPLALIEDSRCPQGVQCVWAGRVRISATISTPTMKLTRELTLGEPFAVANGTLTLAEVRPSMRKAAPIAPGDYRFGFRFDGGL